MHLAQHPGIGPVALIYGNNKANGWHGDSEVVVCSVPFPAKYLNVKLSVGYDMW